ncbi:glycosyltransferase [Dinghuibacter silviterrae]|uniref:Glycosyltransferase involved in cell wall biosynthesis n=1 Tax=Dinghuibacter silviterrae TaxID=1539049 RepID=A0A4R8DQK4_9BACT|nr:glycosyltransferase [Dinghuibacter silviterrae]TDX00068.1 glycosyltransferase involved in cell wall biosynthesis [Dinghuibacter silviterrae]
MQVTYFYRNSKAGFSIAKVFGTVTREIAKTTTILEREVPARRADVWSVVKNVLFVWRHRDRKGINHITGDIHYCVVALIGCKSVLTVHDLSACHGSKNRLKKWLLEVIWFKIPVALASRVVCISEHTRKDLMVLTGRGDIEMIYNAVDPIYVPAPRVFNMSRPVVLQVGAAWNKNFENTVRALSSLPCTLVVVGTLSDDQFRLLHQSGIPYSVKNGLSEEGMLSEYYNCDIVSFCSVFEGFGMPIIEGNAVGRCVVTSDRAPMSEVAAQGACLVDPENISSMTAGYKRVMNDSHYREKLVESGFENVARYDAGKIASAYLAIYSTL